MLKKMNVILILIYIIAVISFDKNPGNLKVVQQQRTGDIIVSVLNNAVNIQKGSDNFYIEFRNSSGNQLIDAGSVKANAMMQMNGITMSGNISVSPTGQTGRYELK